MIHQISNFGDYIVEVDDELYKDNSILDIIELKLATSKSEVKQYQIMAMFRKDNKCYFRIKDIDEFFDNLGGKMNRLTTCKEITPETDMTKEWGYSHIYKRLAEYEDAEEQGQIIISPCMVGDTLYCDGKYFAPHCKDNIHSFKVTEIALKIINKFRNEIDYQFNFDDIGKTVFLTRREAESSFSNEVNL